MSEPRSVSSEQEQNPNFCVGSTKVGQRFGGICVLKKAHTYLHLYIVTYLHLYLLHLYIATYFRTFYLSYCQNIFVLLRFFLLMVLFYIQQQYI